MADFLFLFVPGLMMAPYMLAMYFFWGGFNGDVVEEEYIDDKAVRLYGLKVILGLIGFILYMLLLLNIGEWIYDCIGWKMTESYRLPILGVHYSRTPSQTIGGIMGAFGGYWITSRIINRIEDHMAINKHMAKVKDCYNNQGNECKHPPE